MPRAASSKKETYESRLQALEQIIRSLEEGKLPLDESLRRYEEGIALSRALEAELAAAQQRLTVLRQAEDGTAVEEPLRLDPQEDADADA